MSEKEQSKDKLDGTGIIFIWGAIDDASAEEVCKQIIEANLQGKVKFIQMLINSCGGSCQAGFAIIDLMEWSRIPVYTAGFGLVGSMASLVFCAGAHGHRVVTPSTALLVHHYRSMNMGSYPDLFSMRKYEDFLYARIVSHYRKHSNKTTEEEVLTHLLRDVDTWLTPEDARELGLVDVIQNFDVQGTPNRIVIGRQDTNGPRGQHVNLRGGR